MKGIKPITRPASAGWTLPIFTSDYNKLLKGFQPRDQDDKWFIETDQPDHYGDTYIHIGRSFGTAEHYTLKVRGGSPSATITQITWETAHQNTTEWEAKDEVVLLCKSLTGVDIRKNVPVKPAKHVSSITKESRIIGALLALHAGDSLGATCEFMSHREVATKYPKGLDKIIGGGHFNWTPGHATDDTDLCRAVLLAYSQVTQSTDVAELAGNNCLDWLQGNWPGRKLGSTPVDIGGATAEGLHRYAKTHDYETSGADRGRIGNGSLMRCLPTGLFASNTRDIIKESKRISRITHCDPRCTISCAVYNQMVSKLVNGVSPRDAVKAGLELADELEADQAELDAKHKGERPASWGKRGEVREAILIGKRLDLPRLAANGPPEDMLKGKCSGMVTETLAVAVAALLDERPLKDVLVDVVRVGKDTDTNAAVAGGLLGARDGEEAVPKEWVRMLQFAGEFRALALLCTLQRKM